MEDQTPAWFLLGGGLCFGLLFLVALCVTAYVVYFMYTDANARGENGVLWAVIGFFGGLLGLLVWLAIRPEKKASERLAED